MGKRTIQKVAGSCYGVSVENSTRTADEGEKRKMEILGFGKKEINEFWNLSQPQNQVLKKKKLPVFPGEASGLLSLRSDQGRPRHVISSH